MEAVKFEEKQAAAPHLMNQILANEFALFTKTLKFHWNAEGEHFYGVHMFLDEIYKQNLEMLDSLAERIRSIGARPVSTLREIEAEKSLHEQVGDTPSTKAMLEELAGDHACIRQQIKDALQREEVWRADPGSQGFLVDLLQKHEKLHWLLESHFR